MFAGSDIRIRREIWKFGKKRPWLEREGSGRGIVRRTVRNTARGGFEWKLPISQERGWDLPNA